MKAQSKVVVFYFLYFDLHASAYTRIIRAKNIENACKKFSRCINKINRLYRIDFEVESNGVFIDITDNSDLKGFIF